jgi:hypothetical protein
MMLAPSHSHRSHAVPPAVGPLTVKHADAHNQTKPPRVVIDTVAPGTVVHPVVDNVQLVGFATKTGVPLTALATI